MNDWNENVDWYDAATVYRAETHHVQMRSNGAAKMKMVTKTFTKLAHESRHDIGRTVNKKLTPKWQFKFGHLKCSVFAGAYNASVQCDTPSLLWDAYIYEHSTTFSVTLPERYWK